MRLTLKEIKSVTFGALHVWQNGDEIRFERCTEKQLAAWDAAEPMLGTRARFTTGVRLDFHTDATELSFLAKHGRKHDLLVDGKIVGRVREGVEKSPHTFSLPAGEKRVTLVLPSNSRGSLAYLELNDGAAITPHTYRKKLLFFGDSITQGYNSEDDSGSFAWRLSLALDADSMIYGVGGGFFLPDAIDAFPDFTPDLVIVASGTNDFGHFQTADALFAAANETLARLAALYPDKPRVALTPIWRADLDEKTRPMGTFADCRATVARAARANGFAVIEGDALFPHDTSLFADGYLHPNGAGFAIYAERLLAALRNLGVL